MRWAVIIRNRLVFGIGQGIHAFSDDRMAMRRLQTRGRQLYGAAPYTRRFIEETAFLHAYIAAVAVRELWPAQAQLFGDAQILRDAFRTPNAEATAIIMHNAIKASAFAAEISEQRMVNAITATARERQWLRYPEDHLRLHEPDIRSALPGPMRYWLDKAQPNRERR
jgi:hypothetical protein